MKLISKSFAPFILLVAAGMFVAQPVQAQGMPGDSMSMPAKSMSAGATSKVSKSYDVEIKDFAFGPTTITVPAGAKVTWVNKDEEPHTVFSTDNVFKSKALDTDDKFSFTFAKPGTYKYFCSVHPKMIGTVVVEDSMKKHPMKMDKMN